jgi:hypothetical protein
MEEGGEGDSLWRTMNASSVLTGIRMWGLSSAAYIVSGLLHDDCRGWIADYPYPDLIKSAISQEVNIRCRRWVPADRGTVLSMSYTWGPSWGIHTHCSHRVFASILRNELKAPQFHV